MGAALTRDGREWVPMYLESIDARVCIGCGRCYKVCGRGVLAPVEMEWDDDEDEDDEDVTSTVMSIIDAGACVGCESCAKVCVKNAPAHAAA